MDRKTEICALLREKGHRITRQKKVILDVFFDNPKKMLSVCDICTLIPAGEHMDNATLYRNLQQFARLGILESMVDNEGLTRYSICDSAHHHHFICTGCGRIIPFPCNDHFWKPYAEENDFHETFHRIEIYGKCADCHSAS